MLLGLFAGTVRTEEPTKRVARSFPMKPIGEDRWSGRFPLAGMGEFRPELHNGAGHPNKEREATPYASFPDQAPTVVLERPSSDVVLSKAAAVPLTIAAYDDYGLAEVNLLFRTSEDGPYQTRTLKKYARPNRSDTFDTPLTEASRMVVGGQLRFLIEAKDRKGQTARTREWVVRIAADANAADRQFKAFDKSQDPFQDRLVKLIAEQKKIQTTVEKLESQDVPPPWRRPARRRRKRRPATSAVSSPTPPNRSRRRRLMRRRPNNLPPSRRRLPNWLSSKSRTPTPPSS